VLIPLGTDRPLKRPARVTPLLVLVTTLAYAAFAVFEKSNPDEAASLMARFWVVGGPDFRWYQLFTHTLFHGGLLHLGGNMLFLYVFGQAVEDRLRWWGFVLLYLIAAVCAGWAHAAVEFQTVAPGIRVFTPAIGASGAIAGVTGAFLVLFPRTNIRCFYILGGMIYVPAWFLIGLAIAFNLVLFNANDGIARVAHLAGYACGFGVAMLLLWLKVLKREPYDLFTIFRQSQRRRQFKAAAASATARPVLRPESKKHDERTEKLAKARAAVSTAIAHDELDQAVAAYRELTDTYAHDRPATTMARNVQYRLANHMVAEGLHAEAARAWTRFLEAYHADPEAPAVRVLLARLYADHLDNPDLARIQLGRVLEGDAPDDIKSIARDDLAHLDEHHPPATEPAP